MYLSNFTNEMLEGERSVGGCGCDVVAVPSANKTNKHDQTNMYDYFEVKIYCHTSFQFGQVVISERDTKGKGKCLCLVWWQAKLCQKN